MRINVRAHTHAHTYTHTIVSQWVSQLVSQVMSSNRLAVTVLMDWHDSISLSSLQLSLRLSTPSSPSRSLSVSLPPNHTDPTAVWHLCENKWSGLKTMWPSVNCPTSRPAYVIRQPLRDSSQPVITVNRPTSQLACVPFCCRVHLSGCPSVSACLTVYLSCSACQSIRLLACLMLTDSSNAGINV